MKKSKVHTRQSADVSDEKQSEVEYVKDRFSLIGDLHRKGWFKGFIQSFGSVWFDDSITSYRKRVISKSACDALSEDRNAVWRDYEKILSGRV